MFSNLTTEVLVICSVILMIFSIRQYNRDLRRWAGIGPKPSFIKIFIGYILALIIITVISPYIDPLLDSRPSRNANQNITQPTKVPSPFINPTPRATSTPSCTLALEVSSSYEGRAICVYGNMYRQQFLPYNSTVRIYFKEGPGFFFLCEQCYFTDLDPGDCVTARGRVMLTTDKQPYINVTQQSLDYCR